MTTLFSCASAWATIEYVYSLVMPNLSTESVRRSVRTGVAILAVALILAVIPYLAVRGLANFADRFWRAAGRCGAER